MDRFLVAVNRESSVCAHRTPASLCRTQVYCCGRLARRMSQADHPLDSMGNVDSYWKLSEMEERFNASSGGVRALVSAWLLAALAAIGWLLDPSKPQTWTIPLGLLVVAICALCVIGVATLWVLDQLVFHRLLHCVFLVGLRMEHEDPSLPPIRALMMKSVEGRGTHRWELLFYLGPIALFSVFSLLLVIFGPKAPFWTSSLESSTNLRWLGCILVGLQVVILIGVLLKHRSVGAADETAWFGDTTFATLVREKSFESVIHASRARTSLRAERSTAEGR